MVRGSVFVLARALSLAPGAPQTAAEGVRVSCVPPFHLVERWDLRGGAGARTGPGALGGRAAVRGVPHLMGSLIQLGGFVPALSEPMTHGFEGSKVGAIPIEEGMPQKTA